MADRSWMLWTWCVASALLAVGCTGSRTSRDSVASSRLPLEQLYEMARPQLERRPVAESGQVRFQVHDMPLPALLMWLAETHDRGIVWDKSLDSETVTLDVRGCSFTDVLTVLTRRLGCEAVDLGGTWYLGRSRPEDQAVLVRRCRRLSQEEAQAVLGSLLGGDSTAAFSTKDGLVVYTDRVPVVRKLAEMLEALEQVESVTWCAQIWVTSASRSDLRDLGIDATPAVQVAAVLAGSAGGLSPLGASGAVGQIKLDGALRAIATGECGRVLADPLVLLVDGGETIIRRGSKIPYRTSNIQLQQGATQTTGRVQTINTGVTLTVSAREVSADRCRVAVALELSEMEALVDGLPQIRGEELDAEADLVAGQLYLLGSLVRQQESSVRRKWLQWGDRRSAESSVLQVWAKVYRIASGVRSASRPVASPAEVSPAVVSPGVGRRPDYVAERVLGDAVPAL